ncbi:MAG: hypothetical protein A2Z81_02665 [Omnitrophica WOR_2 bacterium GWA2_45_18]|nr:MAG: hypothetical protein A2Z81_02665 [Omnitrophica WOR_2 bacterium GWA2_45_18]
MPSALLSQKDLMDRYLNQNAHHLSSFSFINVFIWQDFFEFDLRIIHGNLCIFAKDRIGCFLYLPPLGSTVGTKTIEECFQYMKDANKGSGVTRIENVNDAMLPAFPEDRFKAYKKGYEYCYYKKDLIFLRGNPYKSQRASYNHFVKNYTSRWQHYEAGMSSECLSLYDEWAGKRRGRVDLDKTACAAEDFQKDVYLQMLQENRQVHERAMRYYQELGLIGRVVVVDGRIKAYTFGYALNPVMFCVLLEVADTETQGVSVFIFREFCRDQAVEGHDFINVMDDLGVGNVGRVKMSFRPAVLFPTYVITKK